MHSFATLPTLLASYHLQSNGVLFVYIMHSMRVLLQTILMPIFHIEAKPVVIRQHAQFNCMQNIKPMYRNQIRLFEKYHLRLVE